jgi:hypothetical protein
MINVGHISTKLHQFGSFMMALFQPATIFPISHSTIESVVIACPLSSTDIQSIVTTVCTMPLLAHHQARQPRRDSELGQLPHEAAVGENAWPHGAAVPQRGSDGLTHVQHAIGHAEGSRAVDARTAVDEAAPAGAEAIVEKGGELGEMAAKERVPGEVRVEGTCEWTLRKALQERRDKAKRYHSLSRAATEWKRSESP